MDTSARDAGFLPGKRCAELGFRRAQPRCNGGGPERRAKSAESAPPTAPDTLGAEHRGLPACWSLFRSSRAGQPCTEPGCRRVGWAPPHLSELDLQVSDGARQAGRLLVRLPVLHGSVGGSHGSSLLSGQRRARVDPLSPERCAAYSKGDSSLRLYAEPHASRWRGPCNWLQDGEKGGPAGGEGAGPPHPTPPAARARARPRRSSFPALEAALVGAPRSAAGSESLRVRAMGRSKARGQANRSFRLSPRSRAIRCSAPAAPPSVRRSSGVPAQPGPVRRAPTTCSLLGACAAFRRRAPRGAVASLSLGLESCCPAGGLASPTDARHALSGPS